MPENIRDRFAQELGPGGLEARGYVLRDITADTEETLRISGLGSPYDQTTRIEGWFEEWDETVARGAWHNTITKDNADIVSTFNHDVNNLLARTSSGTLILDDPDEGLMYEAQINPDDPNAMAVHARVARRDVTGSSVWFRVTKDLWEEPTEDNDLEVAKRTILEAELFEVGPVVFPAFPQTTSEATTASARQLGYSRASLLTIDGALTAAGVTKSNRRAAYASKFLADPDTAAEGIRALFARAPGLRDQVCDTTASGSCGCRDQTDRAAAAAEPPAEPKADEEGAPQPQGLSPAEALERLKLLPLMQSQEKE